MDRHSNCYHNSAYNRTLDDFDDFLDDSHTISFGSAGNGTFIDDFPDDVRSCYSEDIRVPHLVNQTFNSSPGTKPVHNSPVTDPITSTPKKQHMPTCVIRTPRRRPPMVRSRSFSVPGHREVIHTMPSANPIFCPAVHRSQSSLSLRQQYSENTVYNKTMCQCRNSIDNYELQSYYTPILPVPFLQTEFPFQSYQRLRRNQFLRHPYDPNSSFSSTRPLMSRNTAIISPINYKKKNESELQQKDDSSLKVISRAFTIAADRRPSSKCDSWFEMKKATLPKCTLRTSGFTLLVSGVLSCLLCFHIMATKGKSFELILSLVSGFIIMCLGFTCLWIQQWHWFPNRNYVSGHILLSVFSVLQSACLWLVDQYQHLPTDLIDVMRGALYGLSSVTLVIASLGLCTSCCCKHPPPDNRVGHAVQGFTV